MIKCPNCGSTAQVEVIDTNYYEDGWEIEVERFYACGCGCNFIGRATYICQEAYETIERN